MSLPHGFPRHGLPGHRTDMQLLCLLLLFSETVYISRQRNPTPRNSDLRFSALFNLVALNLQRQDLCHEAFRQRRVASIPSPSSSLSNEIWTGSSSISENLIRFSVKDLSFLFESAGHSRRSSVTS